MSSTSPTRKIKLIDRSRKRPLRPESRGILRLTLIKNRTGIIMPITDTKIATPPIRGIGFE
jgi:hypothetical protein